MDLRTKIRECSTEVGIKFPYAGFVRCCARLRCVVDEIVGEKLFEDAEASPPLDFFGVSADDRFS
jgi:hypothetical protein